MVAAPDDGCACADALRPYSERKLKQDRDNRRLHSNLEKIYSEESENTFIAEMVRHCLLRLCFRCLCS